MIRTLLILWLAPITFFWTWYVLSLNDLGFGLFFFSRELHDLVFKTYGAILDVDPALIPGLVGNALVLDTFIVLGLIALRKRKAIIAVLRATADRLQSAYASPAPSMKESLSSAPCRMKAAAAESMRS